MRKKKKLGGRYAPVADFSKHKDNSFKKWRIAAGKARKKGDEAEANRCMAMSYITDEGFWHYCRDICGYEDLYKPFHQPIIDYCLGNTPQRSRFRMIQAFRGSFKSSIVSVAFPTWMIAREYMLTGSVNIRIGIQSEKLALAKALVRACRLMLESPRYKELFGEHEPKTRTGKNWADEAFTSAHRTKVLTSPTMWTIALGAERTGFHFDYIISDDLQAFASVNTRDQIEKCAYLFKLNHSLLDPGRELVIVCTRWHYDDIYARIEKENKTKAPDEQFEILKLPIHDENETYLFPTMYGPEEAVALKKDQTPYIYSCQYLLQPMADEDRLLKQAWIKYWTMADIQHKADRMWAVVGVDFAWYEQYQTQGSKNQDRTVIMTWLVDAAFNFYQVEVFRKRCTKDEAIREFFRQAREYKASSVGLCVHDRKHVEGDIKRIAAEIGEMPYIKYVTRPKMEADKVNNIIAAVQGIFSHGMVRLERGHQWFEEEIVDFPKGVTDDGLDAMVNAVKAANVPLKRKASQPQEQSAMARHFRSLKTNNPVGLNGKPLRKKKIRGCMDAY